MNTNELAPFGYTKSGRIRKTALKPKIAQYGHTKSGRIRVNPLKSQTHNVCEDCGIKFDNEGWLTLKYCECCDDQRRSDENDVDDRDAPNILPYKQCEDCAPEEEEKVCGLCDCDLGPDSGNDIYTSPRGYIYCESCEDEHTYITAFLVDDLETMKKMTKDKIERGKLQRLDKECRLGRPSKCKCNDALDIRGRCCPIKSPSSFAECPVSYDTTYFCIRNDYEAYKTYCALSYFNQKMKVFELAKKEPYNLTEDMAFKVVELLDIDQNNKCEECICESNEKPNSLCIEHMCCFICSNQHSLIHLNQGTALWLCRECDDKGIWCRGCRNIIDEESGFCSTGCEYEGGVSGGNVHDK